MAIGAVADGNENAAGSHEPASLPREPEGHLIRKPWYRFFRGWSVLIWIAVSIAGLVAALIPQGFPAKALLSSAVIGAGVAGLISEFTFCFDRLDAYTDALLEQQHQASLQAQIGSLEHGIRQVDSLARMTKLVAVTQMFTLGMYLQIVRFDAQGQGSGFRVKVTELAQILGLSAAVQKYLGDPDLHSPDQDLTKTPEALTELKLAVQLRYAEDGVEALNAGSTVGLLTSAPGNLAGKDYRDLTIGTLRRAIKLLYLLPGVYDNLLRAIDDLDAKNCEPAEFIQYLMLFKFYLTYRSTGRLAYVASLFESPVSLGEASTVAEIRAVLDRAAGKSPGTRDAVEHADNPAGLTMAGVLGDESAAIDDQQAGDGTDSKPQFRPIRKWLILFWAAISVVGLALALGLATFAVRDLLGPAVVGAGIAGLISEFAYIPDRRNAAAKQADDRKYEASLEHEVAGLEGQVDQVDHLMKKAEIAAITRLFMLGIDLQIARFGSEESMETARNEAEQLAEILGLSAAVSSFLSVPNLRAADSVPSVDPFPDLIEAVELRYAQDGIEAFKAGTLISIITSDSRILADKDRRDSYARTLSRAIGPLYLLPAARDNMLGAIQSLQDGICEPREFALYMVMFYFYLTYRMTGNNPEVAPWFESPVSLAQPSAIAGIYQFVSGAPGQSAEPPVHGSHGQAGEQQPI
jgi:hypothetical protein